MPAKRRIAATDAGVPVAVQGPARSTAEMPAASSMVRPSSESTGIGRDPSLFIGPVSFVLGMAAALLFIGWLGSVVSLAVLGVGAYVVLIVAMALGGALAYAVATAASGWLAAREAERHD